MASKLQPLRPLNSVDHKSIIDDCKNSLPVKVAEFNQSRLSYEDIIEDLSGNLESTMADWIDAHLKNISDRLSCITPLPVDPIARGVFNSLVQRKKLIVNKLQKSRKRRDILPGVFNVAHIRNVHDTLLPLIAEVKLLHNDVVLVSKHKYKI